MNGKNLREIPLPNGEFHKHFGEIKNDVDGKKAFRPNWKAYGIIFGIVVVLFGAITGATVWVYGQSTSQVDTTKIIKTLEVRVDTLEKKNQIDRAYQTSIWEIQKLILKKLYPDTADILILPLETTLNKLGENSVTKVEKVEDNE